ncbi:MAG: SiaC family regulatory phosphoprotein, partial [Bacteroidales bacterium]|nr:SiaC family regulatory phosphoprotein [Bacteroidales bacterium]
AKIFLLLEKINENVFVQVIWKYKKEDSDMMASGMRFSKLLNLEFELREVE